MVIQDGEEDPVYDIVFAVEKTANLVPYLEELKTNYLLPTLQHFNGGPPSMIDTGHDYNCTLYCLVTFAAGDTAPEMVSDCTYPTTSTYELIQSFDNIPFMGGGGQMGSHISEGLSTALQCLDEIKQLRYSGKPTQRHCILICNSPPYHIVAEESQDYRGFNSEQLASMMGKRGVNLSIISPRKIPSLQKLFNEACAGDSFHNTPQGHYAVDPHHMILLKGFQLQERSFSPKVQEDKKTAITGAAGAPVMKDQNVVNKNGQAFKIPNPGQINTSVQQQPLQQQQNTNMGQQMQMQQQQNVVSSLPSSNSMLVGPMDPVGSTMSMNSMNNMNPGGQTLPLQNNKNVPMVHMRQAGQQGKAQAGMTNPMTMNMPQQQQMTVSPNMAQRRKEAELKRQQQQHQQQQQQQQNPNQQDFLSSVRAPNITNIMSMQPQNNVSMPNQGNIVNPLVMQQGNSNSQMISIAPMMQTAGGMNMQAQVSQQPQSQPTSMPTHSQARLQYENASANQMAGNQMPGVNQVGQLPNIPGPRDRRIIWSGTMDVQDKNMQGNPQQNEISLTCNVSVDMQNVDIITTDWPKKLTMQLIPQKMLSSLQQQCKSSRQVSFHFPGANQSPGAEAVRRVQLLMNSGYAGCVRILPPSETRIILIMYSARKKSFIGLIPNDQEGIVRGIKDVFSRQRLKMGMQMSADQQAQPGAAQQPQPTPGQQQAQPNDQRRHNQHLMTNMPGDMQNKQREMQYLSQQQQQGVGMDQKKVMTVQHQQVDQQQQQQQQVQQQQMFVQRAKLQQQQHQHLLQAQRLQMHQQQQQQQQQQQHQQQQQPQNHPQLRHLLINQMRQQHLMQQQQQQPQHIRGGNPQGQAAGVMTTANQQPLQTQMNQMAPPGQGFMDDFNLTDNF